jgi:hypothetical protein
MVTLTELLIREKQLTTLAGFIRVVETKETTRLERNKKELFKALTKCTPHTNIMRLRKCRGKR